MFAQLGPSHQDCAYKLIVTLKHKFQSYKKEDPLPVKLIKLVVKPYHASNNDKDTSIVNTSFDLADNQSYRTFKHLLID